MEIKVLGCSGGIGGATRRTTAFLVDADILIDCGSGVGDLSFDALVRLDHVFLTHAHLDHIALLPMLVDSVMGERDRPLRVYGLPATLHALQQHIFNGAIWPDFTRLPTAEAPAMQLVPVAHGQVLNLDGRLIFDALVRLDHVFLTHAHLDHIALLPMLVDSVMGERDRPLRVYGLPATLHALQQHIFNGAIWPDFTRLPTAEAPAMQLVPVAHGQVLNLDGRLIQVLPARHSVPAAGYYLQTNEVGFAFTGDTCASEELAAALNALPHLRYLVVETAFPEAMRARAEASSHLHPAALGVFLSALRGTLSVHVTHLKPNCEDAARAEIAALGCRLPLRFIQPGDVFCLTATGAGAA